MKIIISMSSFKMCFILCKTYSNDFKDCLALHASYKLLSSSFTEDLHCSNSNNICNQMCVMVQIYLNICIENKILHSLHYWNKGNAYWKSHQNQNISIDTDKQTAHIYRKTTHIHSKQRAHRHQPDRQYTDKAQTQTAHRHKQTVHRHSQSQQ